ncbi:hypothetical protein B0T10DRAFT_608019 [Thelonectria olida]|uniref:Rhodopsin domain-containing protein n=1 Tax=Thelonectria olida TaxID=1576542 RepID=A0A9P8VZX0_9HYPO|nr:hypothetical protein B0T10DRAFT_608019 [Thelonectria olida]
MGVRDSYYPVAVTFLVVDGIAVGLRFWARGTKKAVGYDDVTMAVSLVGFVIFCSMELQAINYGIGATAMEDGFDLIKAAMYFTIAQIVYILATGISKLGVGLVLFRLADKSDLRIIRWALIASMVIVAIWSLVVALIFALQCRPLSVAWGVGKGTCLSTSFIGNAGIGLSVMDMTISWFYALLPIFMLYKTQLRLKLKISIMVLLGLGAVSSVATIIRFKYVLEVAQMTSASGGLASADIIQTTLEATVYSMIEIGLSIFAASLTALRPLLKKVPCFTDISSGGHSNSRGFSSINTFGQRPKNRDNGGPAIRLDDRNVSLDDRHVSDADSTDNIMPAKPGNIQKQTQIVSTYEAGNGRTAGNMYHEGRW